MSKRLFNLASAFLLSVPVLSSAQGNEAKKPVDLRNKYANEITAEEIKEHIDYLASDDLEGRFTGEAGQKKAADYISSYYRDNGVESVIEEAGGKSYFQKFALTKKHWDETYVTLPSGKRYEAFDDFVLYRTTPHQQQKNIEAVFAGYGREEDLEGLDIKGKSIVVLANEFWTPARKLDSLMIAEGAAGVVLVAPDSTEVLGKIIKRWGHYFESDKFVFPEKGDEKVVEKFIIGANQNFIADVFHTSFKKLKKLADKNLKRKKNKLKKFKAGHFRVKFSITETEVQTENVVGFVEGTDKKDEVLVVSAHYDHIGIDGGKIYYGADDNASGTSSIMEIAASFALAKKEGNGPRRSVMFLNLTAEEVGLLGSEYYVQNPVKPLAKTVTDLNVDMIGRRDEVYKDDPNYVYVIGADKLSQDLHDINEACNETYTNLKLDYTFNDENDPNRYYYRSDHYNFAKNDIPVVFYFNGTHEDYHLPTDTADKIDSDKVAKISKLVFYTAWEVANRNEKPALNQK